MNHEEKAVSLYKSGYNCSQAVLFAFADELGMDKETALKISSSFGGGMGHMREVCGAVSALFMIIGMKYGYIEPDDEKKEELYAKVREAADEFRKEKGSIICRELFAVSSASGEKSPAAISLPRRRSLQKNIFQSNANLHT